MQESKRRIYYDHEPVYLRRRGQGYTGWNPAGTETEAFGEFGRFMEWASFVEPGSALDLGCGGGEISIILAEVGWTTVGVDYSETAISMARENAAKAGLSIDFRVADIAQPFNLYPGTFSLVIDNHVRHCLIDKEHRLTFMRNAYDALAKGGLIYSANMSGEGYINYEYHNIDPATRIDVNNHRYWASLSEMVAEFTAVGFSIRKIMLLQDPPEDDIGDTVHIYAARR